MASTAATFEIRWRLADVAGVPGPWQTKTVPAVASAIRLPDFERSMIYEVEARAVSAAGAASDWVQQPVTVDDPSLQPRQPTGLTALPVADAVSLKWTTDVEQPADVEYVVEVANAAVGPFAAFTRTRAKQYSYPVTDSIVRWFRVRAVNFGVVYSAYSNTVSAAGLSVAEIQAEVTAAQAAADAANAALADIASDSLLTPDEKPRVIMDRDVIVNEQAGIDAKAVALGVTTEKTTYDNAVAALVAYLATLTTPVLWSNLSGNTTIVGTTFRTKFSDVYAARQALLNKIYVETLDQLPDGPTYARVKKQQLQNGYMPPYSFGDELVGNGGFEDLSASNVLPNTDQGNAVGKILANGWKIGNITNGAAFYVLLEQDAGAAWVRGGRNAIRMGVQAATGLVPMDYNGAELVQEKFPVTPGERLIIRYGAREDWTQPLPAGVQRFFCVGLIYYDKNGTYLARSSNALQGAVGIPGTLDPAVGRAEHLDTVPVGAVTAVVVIAHYLYNSNAVATPCPFTVSQVRVDEVSVKRVTTTESAPNLLADTEYTRGVNPGGSYWNNTLAPQQKSEIIGAQWAYWGAYASTAPQYHYQFVENIYPGTKYSLSANVSWSSPGSGCYAQLVINWYNGATLVGQSFAPLGTPAAITGTDAATRGGNVRLDWSGLTAPSNANRAAFHVGFTGPFGAFAISKCKLEQGLFSTPYIQSSDISYGTELTVRGSRRLLGGARNMPVAQTMGAGSVRNTTALTANSSGQVSVAAHSNLLSGETVSYNAVSNAVVGLTVGTTYVIYCFDLYGDGGTRSWFAATSVLNAQAAGEGVVIAGNITIPSSGSSSGGGGGAGDPDDWCPEVDMVLPDGRRVGDLQVGDNVPCWNMDAEHPAIEMHPVRAIVLAWAECAELEFDNGALVRQSLSTPMHLRSGEVRRTLETYGAEILTCVRDALPWSNVVRVDLRGRRQVAKIDLGDRVFFCGVEASATVATHNIRYKP